MFRLCITKKKGFFFCSARAFDSCRFWKKVSLRDKKKTFRKNTSLFRETKNIFPAMFFFVWFFVALNNFS